MSSPVPPPFEPVPPVLPPTTPSNLLPMPPATEPTGGARRRRPRWVTPVVVVASLAVGVAIGAANGTSDPTKSSQYTSLAAQLASAESEISAANDKIDEANGDASDAESAAAAKVAKADDREKKLDSRQSALDKREKSLDKRAKAVSGAEKKAKASEIEDGTWTVGTDIAPGTYKVEDEVTSECYWAILKSGTNGNDIISNAIPEGGYPSVTLQTGQDFENQCGTWKKVG